ncbi:TetR/AcrR family transcriptional regulator [Marinicrinis lubricantis]|uniref:TetR/AcrR family transcriptional regulator n=1 Tax=Marinicrinis lubricantis TaxID=2086470 RepID=A0ABW1ILT6_9BACL
MIDRKQHVMEKAHELFREKGYQATSIQDILDFSGISKGTFYNYFPSKSELFKAVFHHIQLKYEEIRNQLLIGEDLADVEIFIKQLDLIMQSNQRNKMFALIDEVLASNDPDLRQFIKLMHVKSIRWIYRRFIDLFGSDKEPYLLDCAILFSGMLQQTIQYNFMAKASDLNHLDVIRYCVARIQSVVLDVAQSGKQLLDPDILNTWLPDSPNTKNKIFHDVFEATSEMKKQVEKLLNEPVRLKYLQLLDFIQEEMFNQRSPRSYLIESALLSLQMCNELKNSSYLANYEEIITKYAPH